MMNSSALRPLRSCRFGLAAASSLLSIAYAEDMTQCAATFSGTPSKTVTLTSPSTFAPVAQSVQNISVRVDTGTGVTTPEACLWGGFAVVKVVKNGTEVAPAIMCLLPLNHSSHNRQQVRTLPYVFPAGSYTMSVDPVRQVFYWTAQNGYSCLNALYIGCESKIALAPGETKTVDFTIRNFTGSPVTGLRGKTEMKAPGTGRKPGPITPEFKGLSIQDAVFPLSLAENGRQKISLDVTVDKSAKPGSFLVKTLNLEGKLAGGGKTLGTADMIVEVKEHKPLFPLFKKKS